MDPLTEKDKATIKRGYERQLEIEREMKTLDENKDRSRLDELQREWEAIEYVCGAL